MSCESNMAMVDTRPHNPANFSRFSPFVRRNSDCHGSPTSTSAPTAIHPPLTLESIAAELEVLSTSPTGGFNYLSGELYKPRSPIHKSRSFPNISTRCVPSNSPAPLRKTKSVRFADSQGLPLVVAVHQLTNQDSSYTANKIVPYPDDLNANVHLATGLRNSFLTQGVACTPNLGTSTLKDITVNTKLRATKSSPVLKRQTSPPSPTTHKHRLGFSQPCLEPDFFQRVGQERVVLDNVRIESRSLQGTVRVANLAFEKEVIVRWTHDGWRSSHDTTTVFCANDGGTDRFTFELPINGDDVTFCIRYSALGREYWDNNNGQNYTVFSE